MTKSKLISLLLLIILLPSEPANAEKAAFLLVEKGVIVPAVDAHTLLDQCSRESPAGVTGYWTPTVIEVESLEKALPEFASHIKTKLTAKLTDYRRQYAGMIRGEEKFIYVNFFLAATVPDYWKTKAVNICDGGADFWGVEYYPKDKSFLHPHFNGAM